MRKTAKRILLALILTAGMTLFTAGCGEKSIDFQDPLVERCVREQLGKSLEDSITAQECASIKELTICCEQGTGLFFNSLSLAFERGNYVDLSDLKYLTGLTTLEIHNQPLYDQLVNVDAIANCEKLETLSLELSFVTGQNYIPWQCNIKDIEQIVAKLPNLKEFKWGEWQREAFQDWICEARDGKELTFAQSIWTDAHYMSRQIWDENEKGVYAFSELSEVPGDIEDLTLICTEGDEVDFESLRRFKNLRTLTVYCRTATFGKQENPILESSLCKVKNIAALQESKGLYSLNLCGVNGDLSDIGKLKQLKELTVGMSIVSDSSFVNQLSDLRELTFQMNLSEDFSENLRNAKANLQKLHYLCVNPYDMDDAEWLSKLPKLEALQLGMAISYLYDDSDEATTSVIEKLKDCKNLRYFSAIGVRQEGELDVTPLVNVPKLQYVYVSNYKGEIRGIAELIAKKGMKSLILLGQSKSNENDVKWLELGAENESLGRLMIDGMLYSSDGYDYWTHELGEEGVLAFLKERQPAFRKCYENHTLCGGYDAFYGTLEEIESFINQ